ncbi:MAG: hypothetical protein JWO82_2657 [Akkermansiaceae bacterium]|nr:hypothetical protein [Akkermansiaceae bacterium]
MTSLTVGKSHLKPLETVEGEVRWDASRSRGKLLLRLVWFTRGSGTQEIHRIESIPLDETRAGNLAFSWVLPEGPWSLEGTLVKIVWAVELLDTRAGRLALVELVVSPDCRPVRLEKIKAPASIGKMGWLRSFSGRID